MSEPTAVSIVLAERPGYSEGFLDTFVEALSLSGIETILFIGTDRGAKGRCGRRKPRAYVAARIERARPIRSCINLLIQCLLVSVARPRRTARLVLRMRADGYAPAEIVKAVAHNSHILLRAPAGWLHYAFASLAIGREHLAFAVGARMTLSVRGYDIAIVPAMAPGCYSRIWKVVDRVHVISDDLMRQAYREGLRHGTKVVKINPAVDTRYFCPASQDGAEGYHELRILTVGRLHWKKGIESTLEGLALFGAACPTQVWTYTVIGAGNDLERLVYAAHQLGIAERVTMVGAVGRDAVRQHLRESNLYLQYSVQEGFCNSVLEAQAMGVLCIVSDAEGLSENIIDGKTGLVVRKRRPALLALAIQRILHMPDAGRAEMKRMARHQVVSRHGVEKHRREIREFFCLGKSETNPADDQ